MTSGGLNILVLTSSMSQASDSVTAQAATETVAKLVATYQQLLAAKNSASDFNSDSLQIEQISLDQFNHLYHPQTLVTFLEQHAALAKNDESKYSQPFSNLEQLLEYYPELETVALSNLGSKVSFTINSLEESSSIASISKDAVGREEKSELALDLSRLQQQILAESSLALQHILSPQEGKIKVFTRNVDLLNLPYTQAHLATTDLFNPQRHTLYSYLSEEYPTTQLGSLPQRFFLRNETFVAQEFAKKYKERFLPLLKNPHYLEELRYKHLATNELWLYYDLLFPQDYDNPQSPLYNELHNFYHLYFQPLKVVTRDYLHPCQGLPSQALSSWFHPVVTPDSVAANSFTPSYSSIKPCLFSQCLGSIRLNYHLSNQQNDKLSNKSREQLSSQSEINLTQIPVYTLRPVAQELDLFSQLDPTLALAQANNFVQEYLLADIIILACPVYNHTIPSSLKAYLDHWTRSGVTFSSEGNADFLSRTHSSKKQVIVCTAAGAGLIYQDNLRTYLENFFNFIGAEVESKFFYRPYAHSQPHHLLATAEQVAKEQELTDQANRFFQSGVFTQVLQRWLASLNSHTSSCAESYAKSDKHSTQWSTVDSKQRTSLQVNLEQGNFSQNNSNRDSYNHNSSNLINLEQEKLYKLTTYYLPSERFPRLRQVPLVALPQLLMGKVITRSGLEQLPLAGTYFVAQEGVTYKAKTSQIILREDVGNSTVSNLIVADLSLDNATLSNRSTSYVNSSIEPSLLRQLSPQHHLEQKQQVTKMTESTLFTLEQLADSGVVFQQFHPLTLPYLFRLPSLLVEQATGVCLITLDIPDDKVDNTAQESNLEKRQESLYTLSFTQALALSNQEKQDNQVTQEKSSNNRCQVNQNNQDYQVNQDNQDYQDNHYNYRYRKQDSFIPIYRVKSALALTPNLLHKLRSQKFTSATELYEAYLELAKQGLQTELGYLLPQALIEYSAYVAQPYQAPSAQELQELYR